MSPSNLPHPGSLNELDAAYHVPECAGIGHILDGYPGGTAQWIVWLMRRKDILFP